MTVLLCHRHDITPEAARRVGWNNEGVAVAPEALRRMAECRLAFERLIADPEITVYGVTSGYGQHAAIRLAPEERLRHARRPPAAMQANHGEPFPERVTRLMVLARLANFLGGHAAVRPELAQAVAAMLEEPLPPVPCTGAVCAGEILPLSWLFGPLLARFEPREKETLALVNGAPVAAALVTDGALVAQRRIAAAEAVLALAAEAYRVPPGHFAPEVAALWGEPHELAAAQALTNLIAGGEQAERRPYQAPVSFRVLPKMLGRLRREAARALETARVSLAQVSDNPVFLPPDDAHPAGRVLSTGGYHNAAAWPALQALATAYADLCTIADRLVARLLDGRTSGLPDQLGGGEADHGYLGTLGFAAVGYGEAARRAAQAVFLPGSESGGFVQNDVAVPTALAWEGQDRAGRMLDAALGGVAVVAAQALQVTGRAAPPALVDRVLAWRDAVLPTSAPGERAAAVTWLLQGGIYPEAG